jgi:pimeloyl-ACP methyl ester carboxylesterase
MALLGLAACGPPIRVARVSGPAAYRSITANALSSDRASEWTRSTVNAWGLLGPFDDQPEAALATLREIVTSGRGGSQELFALAELSFLHAEETGKRPYHLAAAVYAYAFLFPEGSKGLPGPLDPRTRVATDVYNRAITTAFASRDGRTVALTPGTYPLPFGELEVTTNPAQLLWGDRRLVDLTPVAEVEVRGMRNRHRLPGLGAALTARAVPREDVDVEKSLIAPRAQVATTAVLRLDDVHDGIVAGRLRGSLDLYAASETETVTVEGRELPLEIDETTPVAVQLAGSPVWAQELWGFFGRTPAGFTLPVLVSLEPYRPGRIPVVFVHGTQSSPARWADMANDLLADPWIRQRYQFWYFFYESGNPVAYSGMLLRDKLTEAVARMDPENRDRCLHEMVVIGHSQGGLLTKLTAVDTGDRLWNAIARVPPEEVPGSEQFRNLLRRALFVEPLPFVRRLVFVATPHHGSFLTGQRVNALLRRLVRLPANLVSVSTGTLTHGADLFYGMRTVGGLPTAVDNMTAGNPFLEGLAAIPVADGVPFHSIIAVEEKFAVVEQGNDGVVQYRSAHVEGAASQLVVRSPHSCQSNPHTVQEVRRILHLHGESLTAAGVQCGPEALPKGDERIPSDGASE